MQQGDFEEVGAGPQLHLLSNALVVQACNSLLLPMTKRSTVTQSDPAPKYLGGISARMEKFFLESRQTRRRIQRDLFADSRKHTNY
ncbi:hypothetical protein TSMEX_011109 [Taenia solium]|eukprot:TsM_001112400 transcript=TsM_001112400 gene=TsM_001112400